MNDRLDIDRVLGDWFREGPAQIPDVAVDGIVGQLDHVRQRRGLAALRRNLMKPMLIAASIAAVAVVGVLGYGLLLGGGGGIGSGFDINDADFVSERNQYALVFPEGTWTIEENPGSWERGVPFGNDEDGVDVVMPEGTESSTMIIFSSQLIEEGVTQAAWFEEYDAAIRRAWPGCPIDRTETGELDGSPARIVTHACSDGVDAQEAIAFHGDRVFAFRVFGDADFDPGPTFEAWKDAFHFTD